MVFTVCVSKTVHKERTHAFKLKIMFRTVKQHLYGFNISMFYWSNRVKTTISMFHPSLFMENCHFHGTNHKETISCSLKNQNV